MVWNSKHHLNQTFLLCLSDWYLPSSTFALKIDWVWYLLDLFSLLKYIHFRKTIGQSSFLSKVLSFLLKSKQSQQKWQHFWKKCATVFLNFMADFRPGFCVIRFILSPQIFFTSETNIKKNWVISHKFNFSLIKFQCWTVGTIFTFGRSRLFGHGKLRPSAVGRSRSRRIKKI